MLRGTRPIAQRSLGLFRSSVPTSQRTSRQLVLSHSRSVQSKSLAGAVSSQLAQRTYSTKPPTLQVGRDPEEEKRLGQQKLKSDPSAVSTESSVRHVYEPATQTDGQQPDTSDGLKHDLGIVKDTFSVSNVPKESYFLGLAGTLPYLGTSLSTVFLSWNLNTEPSSSSFMNSLMLSHESAHWWLGVIEPIQLGYGAVIISFLGAIHWGLEYAEKKPSRDRTRFRYGLGVLASVAAWPTMFLPIEFALTSQLAAFTGLYFADTTATRKGWAPAWYSSYRFVLTAIVGAAITISLIGRAKVGDAQPRLSGLSRKFHENRGEEQWSEKWAKLEDEEKVRLKKEKEEEEKKRKEEEKKAKEEEKKNKKKDSKAKDGEKQAQEGEKAEKKEGEGDGKQKASDSNEKSGESKKSDKEEKSDDKADKKEESGEDQKKEDTQEKGNDDPKDEKKAGKESKEQSNDEAKEDNEKNDAKEEKKKKDDKEKKEKK